MAPDHSEMALFLYSQSGNEQRDRQSGQNVICRRDNFNVKEEKSVRLREMKAVVVALRLVATQSITMFHGWHTQLHTPKNLSTEIV